MTIDSEAYEKWQTKGVLVSLYRDVSGSGEAFKDTDSDHSDAGEIQGNRSPVSRRVSHKKSSTKKKQTYY